MDQMNKDMRSDPVLLKIGQIVYNPSIGIDSVGRVVNTFGDRTPTAEVLLDIYAQPNDENQLVAREKRGTWWPMRNYRVIGLELLLRFVQSKGIDLDMAHQSLRQYQGYYAEAEKCLS